MTSRRIAKVALGVTLVLTLIVGVGLASARWLTDNNTRVTGYFANSNGIYVGDDVVLLGVPIGRVDSIEPRIDGAKISFSFGSHYRIPADAAAVILSPQLVTPRAIQLTPAYTGGPQLADGAVIPLERTAVPVEWDEFRSQLEKLSSSLQPGPDGVSPLGAFVNTAADNLRGQGAQIRESVIQLSTALSALGDHSGDIFATVRNLSALVSALQTSTAMMGQLNGNLAAVSAVLANDPDEVSSAVDHLSAAAGEVAAFVAEHREALGTTADKLASVSSAMVDSVDDIKQTLHVGPVAFGNFVNIYEPAHAALTGALAINNFANPISFLCGAIQAASRLGAEQSAKLCVQYLAPIVKNRQYNFPPIGFNPFVGATARPNELTYSEDWLRPDAPLAAEPAIPTDPANGLPGMMLPPGATP